MPSAQVLRVQVYDTLLERGLPPTCADLAELYGEPVDAIRAALGGLKIGKAIHMRPDGSEIWMAGPFSAESTPHRITGHRTAWWANCAWDAVGVAVIANETARVSTTCPDCEEDIDFVADPARPPSSDLVAHFLVPARHWYDDLGFT